MFDYYFYDWDGCLVDTLTIWLDGYRQILIDNYQLNLSDKTIIDDFFGTWEQGPEKHGLNGAKFYELLLPYVNQKLTQIDFVPHALNTLNQLKQSGKKLAIVSSSKFVSILPVLQKNQLQKFFDAIVTDDDVSKNKPDPQRLNIAIQKLQAEQSRSIIIGDSGKDILTGQNAHIKTCLYFPSVHDKFYNQNDLLKLQPNYQIENHSQIFTLK